MGLLDARELAGMTADLDELTNATLTAISAPAGVDGYGKPSGLTPVWEGEAPGYLARAEHVETHNNVETSVERDMFVVLDTHAPVDLLATGPDARASILTIIDNRSASPVTRNFNVRAIDNDARGLLDSTRVVLGDPRPAA